MSVLYRFCTVSFISLFLPLSDPAPPPVPSELHVSEMTFGAERSVSVRLSWSMSADLDIPVNHYKLSWSLSDHTMPPKLKRRQTANGVSLMTCQCLCPFTFSLSLSLFHFLIYWIVPKTPQGLSSPAPSFSKPQQIRYLSANKCKINNSGLGL